MAFRKKNKTRELVSQKETIDSLHKKMKTHFQEEYQSLDDINTELGDIESQITQLRNSTANKSHIPDFTLQTKIWRLENRADEIRAKIATLESKTEEKNYLIKTGKLLSKYYKLIKNEKAITEMTSRMDFIDELDGAANKPSMSSSVGNSGIMSMLDASFGQVDNSAIQSANGKRKEKKEKRDIMDWFGDTTSPITYNMETNRPTLNIKFKSGAVAATNGSTARPDTDKSQFIVHHNYTPNLDFRYGTDDDKSAPHGTTTLQNNNKPGTVPLTLNYKPTAQAVQQLNSSKTLMSRNSQAQSPACTAHMVRPAASEEAQWAYNRVSTVHPSKASVNTGTANDIMDKRKIYDEYMKIIDPNYVPVYEDEFELFDICTSCHSEMVLNHNAGMLNCNNCGMTERIIVDSDKQSHKEPPKEMTSFSYKRINHLNEILSQFQAKETTEIPEHVYDKILLELKKERIENMALLTKDKLREILKKIDETDYYEHIPYIINQLNGLPPPVISPEVEEIIRGLFLQAQHPFNTHCPDARKNFLTYGYTLYKLFELLELDDYLSNFKFLKDRKKLYEQEQIWKKICHELKWEFIPSI